MLGYTHSKGTKHMLAVAFMQIYPIIALTTTHNQMRDMIASNGDSCAFSTAAAAELLGINLQCTMFQMDKLTDSRLHDKQTLISACQTLVLISSIGSSSSATGRELLDVCDSLLQLLGCINDLQDQGQRANVFCTPTRCRHVT